MRKLATRLPSWVPSASRDDRGAEIQGERHAQVCITILSHELMERTCNAVYEAVSIALDYYLQDYSLQITLGVISEKGVTTVQTE